MNRKLRIIMEFAWMAVFIMAAAALAVSAIESDTRNTITFSVIAIVSLFMYLFRRMQRLKQTPGHPEKGAGKTE